MKISEAPVPEFGWAITACDCRGTDKINGQIHELESEDGKVWHCPNCKRTTAQIFGVVEDHGK